MNKLEVLYKMSKTMKEKENIKGNVQIVGVKGSEEFINLKNNFEKDLKNKTMAVDVNASVNTEDFKGEKSLKKEFSLEKMHEMHGGHGKHHGHGKCNKFAKLEILFKTLNDMELVEKEDSCVIKLDILPMLKKKKEKIMAHHKMMKANGEECKMHKCDCEDLKEVFKIKHAVFKEIMSSNFQDANLELTINKEFEIEKVNVIAKGDKDLCVNVELNY